MAGVGRRGLHVTVPVLLPRMASLGVSDRAGRGDYSCGAGDKVWSEEIQDQAPGVQEGRYGDCDGRDRLEGEPCLKQH